MDRVARSDSYRETKGFEPPATLRRRRSTTRAVSRSRPYCQRPDLGARKVKDFHVSGVEQQIMRGPMAGSL